MSKNPKATHQGILNIGDLGIPCYVLEDGKCLISQGGMIGALGMKSSGKGSRLSDFSKQRVLIPFISGDIPNRIDSPIIFKGNRGGRKIHGYDATLLSELAFAVIEADRCGALMSQQKHIANHCAILARAFGTVGIISLIHEATGYQNERDRDALQKILEKYIVKELLPWTKTFQDEFYWEMFRLKGWDRKWLRDGSQKFPYVGKLTNNLVYEKLPKGVLEELSERNPYDEELNGRKHKHHQLLSRDLGYQHLKKHLDMVTMLMRISPTWNIFMMNFNRAFNREGQEVMEFMFD